MTTGDSRWVRRFHPGPEPVPRLVCFPHAGGSASYFFPLSRALRPDVEVLAVQYPGRQDRRHEPLVDTIGGLAERVTEQLLPWLDRPTAFFGHSMGATLAFEVARELERRGAGITALFASGRCAPSRVRGETAHTLSDRRLLAQIEDLSGTRAGVLDDEELVRILLPAIRADYHAAETYRYAPGPDLGCPVHALTGDQDHKVTAEDAAAWGEHTTGKFRLHTFAGGHFFLDDHPGEILDLVRSELLLAGEAR